MTLKNLRNNTNLFYNKFLKYIKIIKNFKYANLNC